MPTSLAPHALAEHADFVRRLAWHLVGDDADADDVAQETLARAIARPPADGEHPRPWLVGVARNVVRHLRRDGARRHRRERVAARPESVAGPDVLAARAETVHALAAAVASLEEPYRTVVLLRYYDALPPREIAVRLGIPVETVYGRLKRARERLRADLDTHDRRGESAWRPALAALFSSEQRPPAGVGVGPLAALGGAIAMTGPAKATAIAATLLVLAGGAYLAVRLSGDVPAPGDSVSGVRESAGVTPGGDTPGTPAMLDGLAADPRAGPRPASGTLPPAPGMATPEANVFGVCVDGDGKPVARATVYLVPKTLPGVDELRGPHATCDDDGRFALVAGPTAGTWIGAVKDGYVPAHADGDALADPSAVQLVLAAGREVLVRMEADDPEALRSAWAEVKTLPSGERAKYPGPGAELIAWASGEAGADATVRLRIGTRGPVIVGVRGGSWRWVTEAETFRLGPEETEARFRFVRSCVLRVLVLDGAARPFESPFQLLLRDAETDRMLNGGTSTNVDRAGVFDGYNQLRVGTYRVQVTSNGFATWTSEPITFARPADETTIRATMVRDQTHAAGTIVFSIPAPRLRGATWHRDPKSPPGSGAPGVLLRAKGADWADPVGNRITPEGVWRIGESTWDDAARILRLQGLAPGDYEALIWDRASWTCGYAAGLSVAAGGLANATVRLVPGVRVRVADLTGDARTWVRALHLRSEDVGDLPAIDFEGAYSSRTYENSIVPPDVVLAPLPFDVVWAAFDTPDGKQAEVAVRASPEK